MMKQRMLLISMVILASPVCFITCKQPAAETSEDVTKMAEAKRLGGYSSAEEYGSHLVTIMACNDCHTPKKMGPRGPEFDSSLWLSGHPSKMPEIDVDRKEMAAKGLVVTNDLTAWVGPWGVSYTANLTPDDTGIGSWTEAQFATAIRKGKFHGMENGRDLLPPMPWEVYSHMTDEELSAVFAYLKSIKPVNNLVPPPVPPAQ